MDDGKIAWAKNGTPHTLSGTGTTFTISDLESKIFNVFLLHSFPNGTNAPRRMEFNGDTGSNYAYRNSDNGSTDGTSTSTNLIFDHGGGWGDDSFHMGYICGVSGQEKLTIYWAMGAVGSGAGNAPRRREYVGKGTNTALLSSIVVTTYTANGALADSNLTVIGTD